MNKIICTTFLLLALQWCLIAETVPFRSGDLLAAEISSKRPNILHFDENAYPQNFAKPVYALLTVKLGAGRNLSVYDYSIEALGVVSPCIAICPSGDSFESRYKEYPANSGNSVFSMLFVLDGTVFGLPNREKEFATLKCNFPPEERATQKIILTNRNQQPFTTPAQIPSDGIMKVE